VSQYWQGYAALKDRICVMVKLLSQAKQTTEYELPEVRYMFHGPLCVVNCATHFCYYCKKHKKNTRTVLTLLFSLRTVTRNCNALKEILYL
jgi:hypothetical protein